MIAVSSFFLEAWYWSGVVSYAPSIGYLPVGIVPSSYGIDAPLVLSYLIAGMGIAIPFSLYTMNKHPKLLINVSTIALLLAGISPLLAPSTSVTTWYRFLIGASPLVSTLSAVGAVESLRDWRALIAFFVIFSLPGLSFAYGYNLSTSYTRELTEFPYGLVPASADCGYLNVEKYFEENYSSKVPIIADPDIARYVHLAVRNPTPSELIWSYPSNSTFCYASSIYSEAFVVTRYDIASMNSICISSYTLEENIKGVGSSIYIYKISFENETNKS